MTSKFDELANRVRTGLASRLSSHLATSRVLNLDTSVTVNKRKRVVLLDLNREEDIQFWQELHNNPDRYQIISEKESHQKAEYFVRIIYFELGDEQPAVKPTTELRKHD